MNKSFGIKKNNILLLLIASFIGLLSGFISLYVLQEQWYLILALILSFLIIYNPIFGVLGIIVLAPFGMFVVIEGLGTISRYLGFVLMTSFAIRLFSTKNIQLKVPKELYWLILFIILGFSSLLWAYSVDEVITRSFTLFQLLILYLITYNLLLNNFKSFKYIYITILITGICIAIYSLNIFLSMDYFTSWTRISVSERIDVNHLASFLLIPFWISFYYSNNKSSIYIIPLLLISITIVLTQSRGALVAIIITAIIYFLLNINRKVLKPVTTIVLLIIILLLVLPEQTFSRFLIFISDKEVMLSGSGRYDIWLSGWDLFKASPIYGIGLGNFTLLLSFPHSSFVQIGTELGILGVFVFFIFLYTLLFKPKIIKNMDMFIVISILIMSLTVDIFYTHYFWLVLCIYSAKKNSTKLNAG